DTKSQKVWSFDGAPYGIAVAAIHSGPVYGASGDGIFQFDDTGKITAHYPTPAGVMRESLKITPNGHLLYGTVVGENRGVLGILGTSSLVIEDRPIARFVFVTQSDGRVLFDASASLPGLSGDAPTGYDWDFDDGTTDRGVTVSHSFRESGLFFVKLTVT